MSQSVSRHLGYREIRGALKVGDLIIPGRDGLPSFSQSGRVRYVDRILDYLAEGDRHDLGLLLCVFAFLPKIAVKCVLRLGTWNRYFPKPLGPLLRFLDIGVKGIFFTLYYSDKSIQKRIGWETSIARPKRQASGEQCMSTTAKDSESTFNNARKAAQVLKTLSVKERLRYVANLKDVILKNEDRIIDSICADTGKTRTDAYVSEIFATLDHLVFLEKEAPTVLADTKVATPIALMGKKSFIYYEPMGVCLIISPWNYPFAMGMVPITSAFVAGNAIVYKPSEFTPMSGLMEDLLREAEIPEHWVQIVYGDGQKGAELIDQKPDKIFFTGSVATGKKIMAHASQYLIPVELELGGKDPMIVFDDANLERVSAGGAWGFLTNMGQACTSVERLYVQDGIYDEFRDRLVGIVRSLKQADADDGDHDLGRMTTEFQVKKVKEQIDDAVAKGARILTGEEWDGVSLMIPPIIIENVTRDMSVYTEETFGPVVTLTRFKEEDEAIRLANEGDYGLSASVWSKDQSRATRVARQIVTGNVSVNNVMLTEGNAALPFGGVKNSGMGRYKGAVGLHAFSNIKSILLDKDSSKIEANWFPFTKKKYVLFKKVTRHLYGEGMRGLPAFAARALQLETYSDKAGKKGRM